MEYAPLGVFYFDRKGRITTCNDKFVSIIGSSKEALIDLNLLQLPDQKVVSSVQKALKGYSAEYEGDYHSVTADKVTPVRVLFAPPIEEDGQITGGVGLVEDVTERRIAEIEKEKSEANYREILDTIEDGYYEVDLKGIIIDCNQAAARMLGAIEEERARLARELHDELGQALTAVKLDIQLLNEIFPENKSPEGHLKQSIDLIDYTIELVRRLSVSLRPPALDDMGLLPAIKNMVNGFMNRTGIKTAIFINSFNDRLAQQVETALYRCVQESLTNIARHAKVSSAEKIISKEDGILKITISDDGIGFEADKMVISSEHIGLTGMKERIKLLNGTFRIDSVPNEGTTIIIEIPWQEYLKEVKANESAAGR